MANNRKFYFLVVFITIFVFGVTLLTTNRFFITNSLFGSTNSTDEIDPDEDNYFKFFPMFRQAYNLLKAEFYTEDKVTAKNLIYGAISGMLDATGDDYTTFMEPEITAEFFIDMNASFGGLGIHIDVRDDWLTVVSPIEDTPAWKAGLKANDKIIEIEGETTVGITTLEAVAILRGEPGTSVTVTILREGLEPFEVTMIREEINLKTVKSEVVEYDGDKIGYIKITEFSMPTYEELVENLDEVLAEDPDGLVIDLRNNPGGLLNVVVDCVDAFIDKGLIVYTRGRDDDNNVEYYATTRKTTVPKDLPIVVMVNQGSASASEIFAGAMQDTHRGVLVGMTTFGKGSVQKTYTFDSDGSMIKYTVALYYTPAGQVINQVGLTPDVEQAIWYEDLEDEEQVDMIVVQNSNFIELFLADRPDFKDGDSIATLQKQLKNYGYEISDLSLEWMVYNKHHITELPELVVLEFDDQLERGLQIFDEYDNYSQTVEYFEEVIE